MSERTPYTFPEREITLTEALIAFRDIKKHYEEQVEIAESGCYYQWAAESRRNLKAIEKAILAMNPPNKEGEEK